MRFLAAIAICVSAAASACAQVAALVPPAAAAPSSFTDWAQTHVHPAVARIVAPGDGSISYGSGTLVYTNERYGLVVTNWHVINEVQGQISVHFPDGFYSLGTIQNVDRDWDLALIAIRKPPVQPVALADRAPQPGETLTIAGYGSGQYRAASGPCTQYVAPGLQFPYEMVEVAVSARQGDSGGPMFNSRGQLAGVLFGEGQGRTAGSYCGRVKWFLSSIVPNINVQDSPVVVAAKTPLKPVSARPSTIESPQQQTAKEPQATSVAGAGFAPADPKWKAVSAPDEAKPPVASTNAGEPTVEVRQIGWNDIAGDSFGEQAKTVLAAVGVLAILLQLLRFASREPAKA